MEKTTKSEKKAATPQQSIVLEMNTEAYPHWYHLEGENHWKPFDYKESEMIEKLYWSYHVTEKEQPVVGFNTRQSIDFSNMMVIPVSEGGKQSKKKEKKLLRATWFWQSDENHWTPYDNESTQILEDSFKKGLFLSDVVVVSKKPIREVRLHTDGSFKQYRRGKNAKGEGRPVQRGFKGRLCQIFPSYSQFAPTSNQMFALPLEIIMKHPLNDGLDCPCIITHCIDFIRKEVPTTNDQLFLEKALPSQVLELKDSFNSGYIPDLNGRDTNTVASLLRLFLETLPEPLSTNLLSDDWQNLKIVQKTKQELFYSIKDLIHKLPPINYNILNKLLSLFYDLSIQTKTPVDLISEKWANCIFRSDLFNIDSFKEILREMITSYHSFFGDQQPPQQQKIEIENQTNSPIIDITIPSKNQIPENNNNKEPDISMEFSAIKISSQNPPLFPTGNPYLDTDDNPVILQTWNPF